MRSLLIHSSGKPKSPKDRRVLHFLYEPALPSGLDWVRSFRDLHTEVVILEN